MHSRDVHVLAATAPPVTEAVVERLDTQVDRYDVTRETSVDGTLEAVTNCSVDCIVASHPLPEESGLQLLERLRGDGESTAPIVFLAADPSKETVIRALNGGADRFLRYEALAEDVTALTTAIDETLANHRANRRAIRHRREYEHLFEHMNEGVALHRLVCDERQQPIDYELLSMNPAGREMLGIDSRDTLPVAASSFFEQEPPPFLDRYARVAEAGESIQFETHFEPLETWFRVSAYSPGENRFATVFENITAQKQRERDLELFRTLMDRATDSIFVVDPATGTICDVNRTACERLAYDREELIDATVWDVSTFFEDLADFQQYLDTDKAAGPKHVETTHLRRDGTTIPVEVMDSTVAVGGDTYHVAIARDISERKERERQLRSEKERLEEFASVLSHDLRSPLEVATGRLELAQKDTESAHLRSAERALSRIDALIEDVLTLVQKGRTVDPDAIEAVSLPSVARACWQTVSTADAELRVETAQEIAADPGRLRELLENLYRNAVEHGSATPPTGGPGEALTHSGTDLTVVVGDLADGFFVADDGPGIPPAERETVFDAGYSTRQDGSGLGLSIVESIAQAHGWTATVTDSHAGGARFEFTGLEPPAGSD